MSIKLNIDFPSFFMLLSLITNLIITIFDPIKIPTSRTIGEVLLISGSIFFTYVLLHLKRGFFGETEPKLDFLVTKGPYRFCRHPQYLSFIIMILGLDLMFRSVLGTTFSLAMSIPSVVYRAEIEENLLRKKFGEKWEGYANRVGFMLPNLRKGNTNRSKAI